MKEGAIISRRIAKYPELDIDLPTSYSQEEWEEKKYQIHVITPFVGGGAEKGKSDLSMPIRPSSIRGHLRFWWRATRGTSKNIPKELHEREREIWGSPDWPSPVVIEITQPELRTLRELLPPRYGFSTYGAEAYALFSSKQNGDTIIKENFSFCMTIRWKKQQILQRIRDKENDELERQGKPTNLKTYEDIGPDIESAIWAWVNFGGIGARTRRGCGALYCKILAPLNSDAESIGLWYKSQLKMFGIASLGPKGWPTIPGKILIESNLSKPIEAWKATVEVLRTFRQGKSVGRNTGKGPIPGRSFWPEPETIRKETGKRCSDHDRQLHIPENAFPRAEFGLPIIFHFNPKDYGEPPETQLYPKDSQRMASPIILRPLAVGDGKKAVKMIIRLFATPVKDVELVITKGMKRPFGVASIRGSALAAYRTSPMNSRSSGSALDAFVSFAKEPSQAFKEVGL